MRVVCVWREGVHLPFESMHLNKCDRHVLKCLPLHFSLLKILLLTFILLQRLEEGMLGVLVGDSTKRASLLFPVYRTSLFRLR